MALGAVLEHFHLGANGDLYIKMKFVTVECSVLQLARAGREAVA